MVEINLISWRAEKQAYEEKVTRQIIAASAAAAMIIMMTAHIILKSAVRHDEKRLQHFAATPQFADVNPNGKIIEYSTAAQLAALFDAAAKTIGSGVCYQRIAKQDEVWTLEGRALTAQSMLSGLMSFEKIPSSDGVVLRELKKDTSHDYYQFVIQMRAADARLNA